MHYILWLILSALFFATGEYFSKKFALNPRGFYVALILFTYSLGTLAWLPAILQRKDLSIAGTIWSVMSLVATVSIGVFIFSEKLNTLSIIGIVFALAAITLLSLA